MNLPAGIWWLPPLGALLLVERKGFGQLGLSRPLPAALLVGAALGDVVAAGLAGAAMELWQLGSASLGGSRPSHETVTGVMVGALAPTFIAAGFDTSLSVLLPLALALPLGRAGPAMDAFDARWAERIDLASERSQQGGERQRAAGLHPLGLLSSLATGAVLGLGALLSCLLVLAVAPKLPRPGPGGVDALAVFLGVAAGRAASRVRAERRGAALGLGVLTVLLYWLARGGLDATVTTP